MKKTVLFTLALAALTFSLNAAPVGHDATRTVAANFWNTYRSADAKPVDADQLTLITNAQLPYLHVYSIDGQGFVIVSADDCARPVPAYSFEGQFPEEINPELRYWLDTYNSQIANAVSNNAVATEEIATEWKTLFTATAPGAPKSIVRVPTMLKTKWSQGDPYNRYCPYDSANHGSSVVGCVATAMAQVMKFWNHPSCGTTSHSYVPEGYHGASFDTVTADFANTTYLWDYMPVATNLGSSNIEINAVATLSFHCGVAVEMMYSAMASGAYTINYGDENMPSTENALKNYFRYDPEMHGEMRSNFTNNQWLSLIEADLALGHPILYTGSDQGGGHAFVLDGADTNGRYHFNLGWSGHGDGYYSINNIAPDSSSYGANNTNTYNYHQTALFGVVPIPQQFDTVDYYDSVCATAINYHFFEYTLPAADTNYLLVHLDTVYNVHVTVVQRRYAYYDPNGGEGTPRSSRYCPNVGAIMSNCPFTNEGHYFAGWSLDPIYNSTTSRLYQPGDTVRIYTNCFFYAIWVNNGDTLGIGIDDDNEVALWPNPTTESISFSITDPSDVQVSVIDSYGRVVISQQVIGGTAKISLERLPAGSYTILAVTNNTIYKRRIIKL